MRDWCESLDPSRLYKVHCAKITTVSGRLSDPHSTELAYKTLFLHSPYPNSLCFIKLASLIYLYLVLTNRQFDKDLRVHHDFRNG